MATVNGDARSPAPLPGGRLVIERLVLWYLLAALAYMGVSMLGGLIMSMQLINHNPLSGIELFSPARWRMVHTNAIATASSPTPFSACSTGLSRA